MDNRDTTDFSSNDINIDGFKIKIDDFIEEKILPDHFNSPFIGQWEITRECNLRCIFCYNNSGEKHSNELTHEQKINVANQIVDEKIYRMCISGGEPILCESFWDIAKILKQGNIFCNTITNGWFVNEENSSLYANYFKSIQISLDGRKKDTHDKLRGKKGSWEKAVNACRLIKEAGGRISIATVVNPINLSELEELIDFTYSLGATDMRLDEVIFTGRASNRTYDDISLSEKQSSQLEKIIKNKKNEYNEKMFNVDIVPKTQYNYVRGFAKIPPLSIYISPTGTCAIDPVLPFSGGSLKEKNLKEIWNELKTIHKNKDFINYSLKIKTGKDFKNIDNIPYAKGELHD
jgi:MoaA/NifB/PqqE/SkfB family radical SAM enzyme